MEPFKRHTGVVVPMDRVNVDTDQIIPKQFLKRIERTGFGQFLFYDCRFDENGEPKPDFILNRPEYTGSTIIAAGRNFGSGSSREHAPWALMDYGFRCVVAPSLADIFQKNCFENGLVPVLLSEDTVEQIIARAADGGGYQLTVDLAAERVTDSLGLDVPFVVHHNPETHAFRRHLLLNGLDDIGLVLQHEDKIAAFEAETTG
jgi:3-isopropylmalate/(R)-2-methylmalate dehydratase small subunit